MAMRRSLIVFVVLLCLLSPLGVRRAAAQSSESLGLRGYGSVGTTLFTASDSFNAVLGTDRLTTYGGGIEVTEGSALLGFGAWRASKDGQRVFVGPDGDVFPLGIPLEATLTGIEVTGAWRFRRVSSRFIPYAGGGYTSLQYKEASSTDDDEEDFDDRFHGFHILGGVDVRLRSWLGVAGEVVWTSVPDAIGESGASQAFDETNLGGTSIRVKVVVGR